MSTEPILPPVSCLPSGRLVVAGDAGGDLGLEMLRWSASAAQEVPQEAALAWLQRFSHQWMAQVCRTRQVAPPPPTVGRGALERWVEEAPPFPGAEYLRAEGLAEVWEGAGRALEAACAGLPEGLDGWLQGSRAGWHLVGRVTFHLAENKRDPEKPFAFLATYADALSAAGTPQHVPLGRALQRYAAAQDQRTLDAILDPVRAAAGSIPWVGELLESRRVFQALAWQPGEAYRFIRDLPELEAAGLVLKVPDWWKGGRPARPTVQVKLDAEESVLGVGAMLRFEVETTLDGTPLSAEDWAQIKRSGTGLVNLRGQWVEIDRERLGQVMDHWGKVAAAHQGGGLSFHEGMRYLAGFVPGGNAGAAEAAEVVANWSEVVAGKHLAEVLEQLRRPGAEAAPQIRAVLRPYQEKGLGWLRLMRRLGLGACLADDMGLGKTLQVIALLASAEGGSGGPVLLVVPASLLGNWLAEFERFAPQLRIFAAHPSRTPREELDAVLAHPGEVVGRFEVVLTTYGLLQRSPGLQEQAWTAVILDEAQAIKNAGTAQAKAVKQTRAGWRLALTGTPVENRPGDLWSLFDFLNPGLLGGTAAFARLLKGLADGSVGYAPLRRLIQPYILRRMKTDKTIIADLPDKTELRAACSLSRKQAILYGKLVEQLKIDLKDPLLEPMARRGLVVGYLLKFKQVCNHSSHWSGDGIYAPEDSGKFQRLAELCQEIAERQERVLIFTQFREIIDPLHAFLTTIFRRPGLILHGGTAVKQRQKLVEQFQAPGGPPFFLLSVKAGGTGLTLTAASHVIHFDRWWNPAVENQATDRAYRIGQKANVLVHKFVTMGTLEERIDKMIAEKQETAQQLLGKGGAEEIPLTEMSNEALLDLVSLDIASALGEL